MGVARPERTVLEGRYTRLEPLDPARHGDQLYEAISGPEALRLHQWLADPIPSSREDFDKWLLPKAASADPLFFAVIDKRTGRIEGRQSIMDLNTDHGSAEIGHILWGPNIARSRVTTEAFYLMADYAFRLGYRRWQWRCNSRNTPSRRAAQRFGYTFEGIFRNHMVVKGQSRDTAWYSIIDTEWPRIKTGFEAWLSPDNFNDDGTERAKLNVATGATVGPLPGR
jgi:RimJ/RimL family protein N-acetyltransferase